MNVPIWMTRSKVFNNMSVWNSGHHQTQLMEVFTAATSLESNLAETIKLPFLKKFIYLLQLEANYFTILWWFFPTLTWISHGWTCVHPLPNPFPPPPSPFHPSGLSQCTSFECPVSCIERGLISSFTYGNINVSMLFSQIIPPLSSPRVQVCSLYLCLFCCLTYRVVITIFLNSIYMH